MDTPFTDLHELKLDDEEFFILELLPIVADLDWVFTKSDGPIRVEYNTGDMVCPICATVNEIMENGHWVDEAGEAVNDLGGGAFDPISCSRIMAATDTDALSQSAVGIRAYLISVLQPRLA